jgi:hypothetical protein
MNSNRSSFSRRNGRLAKSLSVSREDLIPEVMLPGTLTTSGVYKIVSSVEPSAEPDPQRSDCLTLSQWLELRAESVLPLPVARSTDQRIGTGGIASSRGVGVQLAHEHLVHG